MVDVNGIITITVLVTDTVTILIVVATYRLIFEDEKDGVHLYNAVNDQLLHLGDISMGLAAALWDTMDPNVFLLSDGHMLFTYLYCPNSLLGTGKNSLLLYYN